METCENCGQQIGKLETPHVWREHVVCAACFARLSLSGTEVAPAPPPAAHVASRVASADPDELFYSGYGLRVTRSQLHIGSKAYAIANITSVTTSTSEVESPLRKLGIVALILVVFLALILLVFHIDSYDHPTHWERERAGIVLMWLLLLGGFVGSVWMIVKGASSYLYHVLITASSGESQDLRFPAAALAHSARMAVDRAISLCRENLTVNTLVVNR